VFFVYNDDDDDGNKIKIKGRDEEGLVVGLEMLADVRRGVVNEGGGARATRCSVFLAGLGRRDK